jgi:hypothetical protein
MNGTGAYVKDMVIIDDTHNLGVRQNVLHVRRTVSVSDERSKDVVRLQYRKELVPLDMSLVIRVCGAEGDMVDDNHRASVASCRELSFQSVEPALAVVGVVAAEQV